MIKAHSLMAIAITALLAACGGGSDSETAKPTPSNEIALDVVLQDYSCPDSSKQPLANADVLLHDGNGKLLGQFKANSNGHFAHSYNDQIKFVTVYKANASSSFNVLTYAIDKGGDLGKIGVYGVTGVSCNCKNLTIDAADLRRTMSEYRIQTYLTATDLDSWLYQDQTSVQACAGRNGKYGKLQLMLTPNQGGISYSRDIDLDSYNSSQVVLNISDFKRHGRTVAVQAGRDVQAGSFVQTTDGAAYSSGYYGGQTAQVQVFDQGSAQQFVRATWNMQAVDTQNRIVNLLQYQQQSLDASASSIQLNTSMSPTIVLRNIEALEQAQRNRRATVFDLNNGTYNLARYVTSADKYLWVLQLAPQMAVPVFEWPSTLNAAMTSNNVYWVNLIATRYNPSWTYSQYMDYQTQASRLDSYYNANSQLLRFVSDSAFLSVNRQ